MTASPPLPRAGYSSFGEAIWLTGKVVQVDDAVVVGQQRAQGWTDADVQRVTQWAAQAPTSGNLGESGLFALGLLLSRRSASAGQHLEVVPQVAWLPWMMLAVGAPGWSEFRPLRRLILAEDFPLRRAASWLAIVREGTAWLALGRRGALAYAAGLSAQEATERHAVGTLDPESLRALAALRGWHLPADL